MRLNQALEMPVGDAASSYTELRLLAADAEGT